MARSQQTIFGFPLMRTSPERPRQTPRSHPHKARPRKKKHLVSIIGAGRMGTALGLALKAAGYRVEIVVAQGPDHARRAAKAIGGGALGLSAKQLSSLNSTQLDRLTNSSLVLITTPDHAIAEVARRVTMIFKSVRATRSPNRRI